MPILERTPFRWSHVFLPLLYLTLGAMIGYVAPIMWGSRPGKTQMEKMKESSVIAGYQWRSAHIVAQLTRVAHFMEKDGLFEIEDCGSGSGMSWDVLPDGSRRVRQDWQIHLATPQDDPAKRRQVEERYVVPMTSDNYYQVKIDEVTWPDSRTVNVSFQWMVPPQRWEYQTTNFLQELRWQPCLAASLGTDIDGTQSSLSGLLLFESDAAPGVPMDEVPGGFELRRRARAWNGAAS